MFNPLNLFNGPKVTKEVTPAAQQAHGILSRLLIRTAMFGAIFGATQLADWLAQYWAENPLTSRFGAKVSRMLIMGGGAILGGTLFMSISKMLRDAREVTLKIPRERDNDGKIVYDTRKVTFASDPDLETKFNDILAGHDEEIYVGLPSDGVALATLGKQIFEVREALGIEGLSSKENPTMDSLKAKLSEIEDLRSSKDQSVETSMRLATAVQALRTAAGAPNDMVGDDLTEFVAKQTREHDEMNVVLLEVSGKKDSAGARELRRLYEKGAAGEALTDGFRFDAEKKVLVYKSAEGKEVETSLDTLRRAADVAAELEGEAGHEALEIAHEGGGMYQVRSGEDRTPLLTEKVRGKEAAQKLLARLIVEQNRGRLGKFGEEGFTLRVNEIAIAAVANGQVAPAAA